MKTQNEVKKSGFTLLELLIVILIIGILSAIVLPKYQLAADRAKMTQLKTAVKAISEAQRRYLLVNDNMNLSLDLSFLDIEIEGGTYEKTKWENDTISFSWGKCSLSGSTNIRTGIYCNLNNPPIVYLEYITQSGYKKTCCATSNSGERGKRLCQSEFPKSQGFATDTYCGNGGTVYNYK